MKNQMNRTLTILADQFVEAGVKAENITMTLQYLNADGTVLYEGAYTYTDLAAAVNPAA